MSITAASILKDGTIGVTGGTATPFTTLGQGLDRHEVFFDGSDIRTRSSATFQVKAPKVSASAPNGYTQARCTATIRVPLALDNGNVTVNTLQISFASDVETTDAEKDTLLGIAAQVLSDSDFASFWKSQAIG